MFYNSYFADQQGEVDVVGVKPGDAGEPSTVYLCEVTTHIDGMDDDVVRRAAAKLERTWRFGQVTFPDEHHVVQWWSLRVPVGNSTREFARIHDEWADQGRQFELICNEEYTARVGRLIERARASSSMTNEPAYRFLQMLTRLRGNRPAL